MKRNKNQGQGLSMNKKMINMIMQMKNIWKIINASSNEKKYDVYLIV